MTTAILPASSGAEGNKTNDNIVVHNGMLFLLMMCNNFNNKQMDSAVDASQTIQLLTAVEMKLSNAMMDSLNAIQEQMNTIIESGGYCPDANGDPIPIPSNSEDNGNYTKNNGDLKNNPSKQWTYNGNTVYGMDNSNTTYKMQSLNAQYSTVQTGGNINTTTIQGFIQAFQTALQMVMSGMQTMTSMYDSITQKQAYDASLVAS